MILRAFFARLPDDSMVLFRYYLLGGDTAAPSGHYAKLCHAFIVNNILLPFPISFHTVNCHISTVCTFSSITPTHTIYTTNKAKNIKMLEVVLPTLARFCQL